MKHKILVIDDDPTLLDLLCQYLVDAGYDVFAAPNGTIGLRLAYGERPDLVLLDVMLREMTKVPIVMITAKSNEADKLRGFRLGVDDYVTKPFSFAELVARMQAVLARTGSSTQETGHVIYGAIKLDLGRYRAFIDERSVELTPTEFRLLEALVRRRGQVATERELIEEVWGEYHQEDASMVRRYILTLRKKVEQDPSNPKRLLTVRGFGYRLGTGPLKLPGEDNLG